MEVAILLINGSLRAGSVNAAVLNTAAEIAPAGCATRSYSGMAALPHFSPDDDHEPLDVAVQSLRVAIGSADAVMFCTPEYAGGLPGSFKNLLDWTVGSTVLSDKPVGWINAASAAAPAGGEDAYYSLRKVMGYVGALVVDRACVRLPVARAEIDGHGLICDGDLRLRISEALAILADSVQPRRREA